MLWHNNSLPRLRGSIPTKNARVLLARDIHDGIAQDLVAVGYRLDCLLARPDLNHEMRTEIRSLRLSISETLAQVRRELFELRTDSVEPLKHRLSKLFFENIGQTIGSCEVEEIPLPSEYERVLYDCAKELLSNALRHSQAQSISLRLLTSGDRVVLNVSDDGNGKAKTTRGRFGLVGIQEKVEELGGSLKISGNHGSTIEIALPLFSL